jgi:hypothetical protein
VPLAPLIRLAQAAKRGVDSEDMAGIAAIGDVLEASLADGEYDRFMDHATRERADGDAMMQAVARVIQAASDRPTLRPSDSSDGSPTITPTSTAGSSSRVLQRLEGRPDLQLVVARAAEARAS